MPFWLFHLTCEQTRDWVVDFLKDSSDDRDEIGSRLAGCGVLKSHRSLASSARVLPGCVPSRMFSLFRSVVVNLLGKQHSQSSSGRKTSPGVFLVGMEEGPKHLFLTHKKAGRLKLVRTYRPPAVTDSYLSQLALVVVVFSHPLSQRVLRPV